MKKSAAKKLHSCIRSLNNSTVIFCCQKNRLPHGKRFFLLYRKLCFHKAKILYVPGERTLHVLGDGQIENGRRRHTAKPFSCFTGNSSCKAKKDFMSRRTGNGISLRRATNRKRSPQACGEAVFLCVFYAAKSAEKAGMTVPSASLATVMFTLSPLSNRTAVLSSAAATL